MVPGDWLCLCCENHHWARRTRRNGCLHPCPKVMHKPRKEKSCVTTEAAPRISAYCGLPQKRHRTPHAVREPVPKNLKTHITARICPYDCDCDCNKCPTTRQAILFVESVAADRHDGRQGVSPSQRTAASDLSFVRAKSCPAKVSELRGAWGRRYDGMGNGDHVE